MILIFLKISVGMWLTTLGAIIALAGQVKVYFENQVKEKEADVLNQKFSDQINTNGELLLRNQKLSEDIKVINQELSEFQNDEAFFRTFDHSYIKKYFPEHSAYIFRQTNSGRVFSKSISTDSKIYELYDAELIFKGNKVFIEIKNKSARHGEEGKKAKLYSNSITEQILYGEEHIDKMQHIRSAITLHTDGSATIGVPTKNNKNSICKYLKLIDIDSNGTTFAIGRAKCAN